MPVILDVPPGWLVEERPDGGRVIRPGPGPREPVLTLSGLIVRPDEPARWIDAVVGAAQIARTEDLATRSGWPLRVVEAEAGGALTAFAFYAFHEHAASVTIAVPDRARYDELSAELAALLLSARPDFRSEAIAALDQLYDLD